MLEVSRGDLPFDRVFQRLETLRRLLLSLLSRSISPSFRLNTGRFAEKKIPSEFPVPASPCCRRYSVPMV